MFEQELELENELEFESEFESELESALEASGEYETSHEFEHELEYENEFELGSAFHEGEGELNPVRRVYLDAMLEMEHFAAMAAESENEDEAEQFLPLLLPLAAKALPFIAKAGAKVLPKLAGKLAPKAGKFLARHRKGINKGIQSIGRSLIRQGRSHLNRALPTVVRRTVGQIYNQTATGRSPTPQQARNMLFSNARRILGNPAAVQRAIRNSRAADQIYHRRLQGGGGGGQPRRVRPAQRGCGCCACSCNR
jgi:hypothetical protein